MRKIIFLNISLFLIFIIILLSALKILNQFISGPARYHEIVYNLEKGTLSDKKKKLVYYKSLKFDSSKRDFYYFNSEQYKKLNYSGPIKNENCGEHESGKYQLIYALDKKGFRENDDKLYNKTDIVLLGDSFVMSVCENKPNDFKSQLEKLDKDIKYLNLGVGGDNFVRQLATLVSITKDTEFESLIWFFYEGNDYNDELSKYEFYLNNIRPNHNEQKNNIILKKNFDHYSLENNFNISIFYKFKVWLAEYLNGLSSLVKIFKKYEDLLHEGEYSTALNIAKNYLDEKKINKRFIYYIPSWQRLSNYKSKKVGFYQKNPQIKQLNKLKNNIKKISEKNGFVFIDGENKFINLKDPLKVFHYKLNTHFNKMGYRIFAEDVFEKIINK